MKHTATGRFWECYDRLPETVRSLADKSYQLLKDSPRHPSLHFKKVGKLWSVRVGDHYRALAVRVDGGYVRVGSAPTRSMTDLSADPTTG